MNRSNVVLFSTIVLFSINVLAQKQVGIPLQATPAASVPAPVTPAKPLHKHPKLSSQIADLARAMPQRTTPLAANERVSARTDFSVESLPKSLQDATRVGLMKINASGEVQVYIEVTTMNAQRLSELQSYGMTVQIIGKPNPNNAKGEVLTRIPTVQGLLPVTMINQVAALPFVRYIRLPDYGFRSTGSVDSQGDQILQAAQARSQFGVDGTGVRIGVISGGIGGVFASGCTTCGPTTSIPSPINTGDLPNATGTRNTGGILTSVSGGITAQSFPSSSPDLEGHLLPDGRAGVNAEGTAMLEIVHDLAPGAQLYFANPADGTSLSFEQAVNYLAANTDVVVDDISFHSPPYDGTNVISSNTATALNTDTNTVRGYFTAVANQALNHWGESWTDSTQNLTLACPPSQGGTTATGDVQLFQATSNTIDFGKLGPSIANPLALPNGATLTVSLSWNDPFSTSSSDYDLYLYLVQSGSLTTALACSVNPQTGSQPPIEQLSYTNTSGATQAVAFLIQNFNSAAASRSFDIFVSGVGNGQDLNFYSPSGSVPAQSDAGGSPVSVVSVGAVDQTQCPGADNCTSSVEPYSSQGPTEATPQGVSRMKPDVTATDDVAVTGAGGFGMNGTNGTTTGGCAIGETPCYFAGTSAAAPHVAAVAALTLQAAPCLLSSSSVNTPATARTNLRNFITSTAVPLPGVSQAVPNNIEGFGLVDALGAVRATLPTPNAGTNQTVSGSGASGAAITLSGSGTDPNSCSLTFSWSGACGTASGSSPKLTCPLGVNTETLMVSNGGVTASQPTKSVQITVTDFTVSNLSNLATISAGQSAQFNLSVGTQFGAYSNAVALSCSSLPALSTCSFSAPSVTPGSSTASSTMTISTAPHSAAMSRPSPFQSSRLFYAACFAGLLPFGVLLSGKRGRGQSVLSFIMLFALASLCFQTGCSSGGGGGSKGSGGTPAGTYTVQVTGTAGSLTHSTTVSLTVQ